MAYHYVALIDLYMSTKFCSNWTNFLWTYVHTGGWTLRPALLGGFTGVDLKTAA